MSGESRWETVLAFAGYGAGTGVIAAATLLAINNFLTSTSAPPLSDISTAVGLSVSLLASNVIAIPFGFLWAQIAAVPTGLIYAFLPQSWQRMWVATLIGVVVTAASFGALLYSTLGHGAIEVSCVGGFASLVAAFFDKHRRRADRKSSD